MDETENLRELLKNSLQASVDADDVMDNDVSGDDFIFDDSIDSEKNGWYTVLIRYLTEKINGQRRNYYEKTFGQRVWSAF